MKNNFSKLFEDIKNEGILTAHSSDENPHQSYIDVLNSLDNNDKNYFVNILDLIWSGYYDKARKLNDTYSKISKNQDLKNFFNMVFAFIMS